VSDDRGGRFLTRIATGRFSLLELVSRDVDELDELLLLLDLDLEHQKTNSQQLFETPPKTKANSTILNDIQLLLSKVSK
jgi:hypothetical protein